MSVSSSPWQGDVERMVAENTILRDGKVLPPPNRDAVERFVVDTYMERHARKR